MRVTREAAGARTEARRQALARPPVRIPATLPLLVTAVGVALASGVDDPVLRLAGVVAAVVGAYGVGRRDQPGAEADGLRWRNTALERALLTLALRDDGAARRGGPAAPEPPPDEPRPFEAVDGGLGRDDDDGDPGPDPLDRALPGEDGDPR